MKNFLLVLSLDQKPILVQNLKDVWAYEINPYTKEFGVAFSDDNWEKKTIFKSKNKFQVETLKLRLRHCNKKVFYI